jgi:hypothetical protein
MTLRLFGGWRYSKADLGGETVVEQAYAEGVPMGSDLPTAAGTAPTFLVWADRDPSGANLDRIQIVKGWIDASGESFEKIFDVAASDGRIADPATGRLAPVGNSVDVERASYENTIGAAHLEAFWRDPEFDPAWDAFYYARVLEIPTPRMSTYDARAPAPEPASIQERAISSPIWYGTPAALAASASGAPSDPIR